MDKRISEIICSKNDNKAKEAAKVLISSTDFTEFKALCEKMDYLFDFVRENVYKRLSFAINKDNFKNILKFFDYYSPYFDDFFSSILAKYANEDLTDEILEILSGGNDSQKAYAASYFARIPDSVATDDLKVNLNTDFDPLFVNCATALGKITDNESYEKYISDLKSDDDFVKLKAVKFLTAYGDKNAVDDLVLAMKNSAMSENIAGEITALISPLELLTVDFYKGILYINNLINGLGEILPLENMFEYEIYEIADFLINNSQKPESALILFSLKNKFDTITQNEEYTFDLDKDTKNEVFEIKKLLYSKSNDFWSREKSLLNSLIKDDNPLLHTVFEIIKENEFKDFMQKLTALLKSEDETIKYEALVTIKALGELPKLDKSGIEFKNPNLKAAFEQMLK